jgi:lysophospholipase L1-like esterase
MKRLLTGVLGCTIMVSCSSGPNDPTPISNKLLPLGASRVQGNPPYYYSFRYPLWELLVEDGYVIDYLGNEQDNYSYGSPLVDFDTDHEGHSGWTSGEILDELGGWLATIDTPQVVLFSSPGGNDVLDGLSYSSAITNVNAIIDTLQKHNPNITILIERMAPGHSFVMVGDLKTYFDYLETDIPAIADAKSTATSSVIVVDMATGFSDSLLADPIHYNEVGASFIAERYHAVLKNVLIK